MQDNLLIAMVPATAMAQQLSHVLHKVDLLLNTLARLEKTRNFPVSMMWHFFESCSVSFDFSQGIPPIIIDLSMFEDKIITVSADVGGTVQTDIVLIKRKCRGG